MTLPKIAGLDLRTLVPLPVLPRSVPAGQVVVVTGASSGIGRATAVEAARRGHHVVLAARRQEVLDEVAAECDQVGAASTTTVATDVADDGDAEALLAATQEAHGRVDAVLHCAGVVTYGRVEETGAGDFDQVLATNISGTANVARHTLRLMREQERGTLVLVGSLLGHVAVPEMTPYVVSKWGVRALARQLHIENLDLPDVHVCLVSPGSVDTPIYSSALDAAGGVNSAPPPAISPERVAGAVLAQLAWPRSQTQTQLSNYGLMLGFGLAPWAWDRVVGPAFRLVSRRT